MLDSSVIGLVLRLVVSLAIVIGVMFLLAAAMRKRGMIIGTSGAQSGRAAIDLEIIGRRPLGRNAQLAVVRAADRVLVLGITEHQITMLTETDLPPNDLGEFGALDGLDIAEGVGTAGLGIHQSKAQRTALSGTQNSGSFPTWKTLIEHVRDRTIRH